MWWAKILEILRAVYDGTSSLNVTLVGGAVGGQTVAQGDPNADATKGWPVRLFNASGALLGRLAAAASIPVVLSTEDKADIAAILAKIIAAPSTEAKQDSIITLLTAILAAEAAGDWNVTSVKTANYNAVIGDCVVVDTTGGAFNVNLPAISSANKGRRIMVTSNVLPMPNGYNTIPAGTNTIFGGEVAADTPGVSPPNFTVVLVSDGTSSWLTEAFV